MGEESTGARPLYDGVHVDLDEHVGTRKPIHHQPGPHWGNTLFAAQLLTVFGHRVDTLHRAQVVVPHADTPETVLPQ